MGKKKDKPTVIYKENGEVSIPKFDDLPISTKTFVIISNICINPQVFFDYIPITDYVKVKKRRGRKRKNQPEDPNLGIPPGSIIGVGYGNERRGVILKKNNTDTYFRHSVMVIMFLENGKTINAKVSTTGTYQMTGCRSSEHPINFVKYLYLQMKMAEKWTGQKLYSINDDSENNLDSNAVTIYKPVMTNKDFRIGFGIDRTKLRLFIHTYTDYVAIWEGSIGTPVNIKVKNEKPFSNVLNCLSISEKDGPKIGNIKYKDYFDSLDDETKKEELKKYEDSFHTFLVFATGAIIMSSEGPDMVNVYNKVVKTLVENRHYFEEPIQE